MTCEVINIRVRYRFERQAVQYTLAFAARHRPQRRCYGRAELFRSKSAGFAQTDNRDTRCSDTRDTIQYAAVTELRRQIAALDQALDFALAGSINIGGTGTKFAALVNANDHAVNSPARRFARRSKILHRVSFWLSGCREQNKNGSLTDYAYSR